MVTVVKTSDDDTVQFHAMPSGLSGTVYVRVVDTDQSANNTTLDSLYVDALFIVSDLPTTVPTPANSETPAHGAVNVALAPSLDWTAGLQAATHEVYFGTNPNPDANDYQGNQLVSGFNPGTLAYNTTYYWVVDEENSLGTAYGAIWSFTTEDGIWVELTFDDFEAGWGNWVDGGVDAKLSANYAIGTQCMDLEDNTGDVSSS